LDGDYVFSDPEKRFIGWPIKAAYINGVDWKLLEDIGYITKAGEISTIRKGFIWDFASIPWVLQWLYPSAGDGNKPYGIAATWHDWLYAHRKIGNRPITRQEADDLFYEIMRYTGVGWWTSARMWRAVRLFGAVVWNRRKPEDIIP
jgi:hypothetical protein